MPTVLAFGAHPDDLEFGMGGTLLKLVDKGFKVVMVVLTKGEAGTHGTPEIREKECKKAAEFIGAEIEILDFKDCHIEDNVESRHKIADVIRKYKPDLVFAPYHTNKHGHKDGVAHPDHTATGNIVRHALRFAKFKGLKMNHEHHFVPHVIYYMIPRYEQPTLVNDISEYFEKWIELAKLHESQLGGVVTSDRLSQYRKHYGSMIKAEHGEGFIVDEPINFSPDLFR